MNPYRKKRTQQPATRPAAWMLVTVLACVLLATQQVVAADRVAVEVQLVPLETSVVAAARSGLLSQVEVEEGQHVTVGTVVADLDSRRARLEVERAETANQLARQKAQSTLEIQLAVKTHALAKTELRRAKAMNERIADSVSGREIDALQLSLDKAALGIEQAEEERSVAELEVRQTKITHQLMSLDLDLHQLRSPISGLVVEVHKRRGEWVESGTPILEITPVDVIRAEGFLPPGLASEQLRGNAAELEVNTAGQLIMRMSGTIVLVAPDSNPVNGLTRFRAEFARSGVAVRPGMAGVVRFEPPRSLASAKKAKPHEPHE